MIVFYLVLRTRFSRNALSAELRSEVDKLIIDLGREADRDVALLESRIKSLRTLIDEADRRIVLSNRETAKREDSIKIYAGIQRTPSAENAAGVAGAGGRKDPARSSQYPIERPDRIGPPGRDR